MKGKNPNTPKINDLRSQPPVKPSIAGTKLVPKAVTASNSNPGGEPKLALDGDETSAWSAGDVGPPQWIQLDLGEPTTVSGVLLDVGQTPDGPTIHQIYGG